MLEDYNSPMMSFVDLIYVPAQTNSCFLCTPTISSFVHIPEINSNIPEWQNKELHFEQIISEN